MSGRPEIGEDELHAFVDGALPPERAAAVEAALREDPALAAEVDSWRAQNEGLHALFDPVLREEPPAWLAPRAVARRRRAFWLRAAAGLLLFLAGVGAGWTLNALLGERASVAARLADESVSAHKVFTVEVRHPVEVAASEEQHLVAWLSKRLGAPLKAPDLSSQGFALVGGRLLASAGEPAAQFMYENAEKARLTIYVRRNPSGGETAFRIVEADGLVACWWRDGPLAYAVVGQTRREELLRLARLAYDQLSG
jgi:anti-sigma factor RsiW